MKDPTIFIVTHNQPSGIELITRDIREAVKILLSPGKMDYCFSLVAVDEDLTITEIAYVGSYDLTVYENPYWYFGKCRKGDTVIIGKSSSEVTDVSYEYVRDEDKWDISYEVKNRWYSESAIVGRVSAE